MVDPPAVDPRTPNVLIVDSVRPGAFVPAGLDALHDLELTCVIMWVPAEVVTAGFALALFVAWLGAIDRRNGGPGTTP